MKHFTIKTSLLGLTLMALLPCFYSCIDDEPLKAPATGAYRTNFNVTMADYDGGSTRAAAYEFVKGDRVYVLFHQGEARVAGIAEFDGSDWTLTPESPLAETQNATCQLAFFLNEGGATSTMVTLGQQTAVYTTATATYQLTEGFLTVHGQLLPTLGRIRFRGTAGQTATLDGLAFAASFDLKNHTLSAMQAQTCAMTVTADGFTPYYYATFADATARQMTFAIDATSGLRRSFGGEVLAAATSGYITIPTTVDHLGWTIVDPKTGEEIVVTTLGDVTLSGITGTEANAECRITGGASKVNDAGFCWSATTSPTVNDSHVSCGQQTATFSAKLTNLTESTTYYIRAYATTDRGVVYGPETTFITRPPLVGRALLAYYTFDDGTCDNVRSDNYHGYLVGNGTFITDTPNGEGKALSLLKEQYVNISTNPLGRSKVWTVSMWVKDFGTGFLFGSPEAAFPNFFVNPDGYVTLLRPGNYAWWSFAIPMTSYQTGKWVHIAIVVNGSRAILYVNGRNLDTQAIYENYTDAVTLTIGGKSRNLTWADPMKVDNVRIHGAVLTDEEVKQIYDYEK